MIHYEMLIPKDTFHIIFQYTNNSSILNVCKAYVSLISLCKDKINYDPNFLCNMIVEENYTMIDIYLNLYPIDIKDPMYNSYLKCCMSLDMFKYIYQNSYNCFKIIG